MSKSVNVPCQQERTAGRSTGLGDSGDRVRLEVDLTIWKDREPVSTSMVSSEL